MKHYIPRRLLALALSVAMVLSMTCTAFATESGTTDTDPFDFSDEIAAQAAVTADADAAADDAENSTESDEETGTETVTIVSSVSSAAVTSEENTETTSEETVSDEAASSEDSASDAAAASEDSAVVEITSSDVGEDGYLYVDGKLYTGYYMDEAGLMFTVTDGVYSAYSGNLSANKTYYQAGIGKVTSSVGLVYLCGAVYTGYYMTSNGTLYYTDATSGYATYSGLLSGSSTYVTSVDFETHQATSTIYKNGTLYTGYYMTKGNVMYKVTNGVYSKYNGNLIKGTQYYKDGSGTLSLSVSLVYLSGIVYTGYYMTSNGTLYYTDATSGYATYSGLFSASYQYLSSVDFETYPATSTIYWNGTLYTGYYMTKGGVMYKVTNGVYSKYSGNLSKGKSYYKDGTGMVTLSAGFVYISGKVYTGYYMTSSYLYYTDSTSGYALYSGTAASGKTYVSSADMQTYTFSSSRVYVQGVLYSGYYMTTANVMYTVTNGVYTRYTGTLSSGTKYYMSGSGYVTLGANTQYKDGVCLTGTWKFSNNYAYYYVGGQKVTGWYYIKRNGTTYKYYFASDGHLVTNMYAYFGSSYKYNKCKLVVNIGTHNASLLGYDSATGTYCIPYYSFIVSTAKKDGDTPVGTYTLSSSHHKKWFTFVDEDNNNKEYYYAYATLISGSGSWFHSQYYTKSQNLNSLSASAYNNLGTNQSSKCVRAQLYVAKLVYDIRDCYSGSIKVEIVKNSTKGPYGKITLSSTTGKISSSTKSDPTGVSGYTGYIKQTAE
ncbi:MAG: hypothetical protein LUC48_05785 [Clostridiales bacterium]|nr:hypothetical protein [Clostridiales bacterium]